MSATEQVNDSGEKNEIRSVEEKFEQCCNKVPSHNSGHRKLSARNKKRRGQVRAVRNGPNVQGVRDDRQSISINDWWRLLPLLLACEMQWGRAVDVDRLPTDCVEFRMIKL